MKQLLIILSILGLTINVHADEPMKKTLTIVYEKGKTPEELFNTAYEYFKKLTETGELKSAEFGTAKNFGKVIDIQTKTDDTVIAHYEKNVAAISVRNMIEASNLPYSGRFAIHSTNYLFGDKSLGYVINPYLGCYDHDFLAKGLEKSGFMFVNANQQPDITMTIGIDTCMSENEFKEYIQKNTALKAKNLGVSVANNSASSSLGNDLIRSGSSVQLGTPSGGGNAGLAVAGVGLALNMANWLTTKSPQERDVIRYHVKFEGKNKKPLEFYPIVITNNTHTAETPVHISSKFEAEKLLYSTFLGWNLDDKELTDKLPPLLLEKDVFKMVELMVASKK